MGFFFPLPNKTVFLLWFLFIYLLAAPSCLWDFPWSGLKPGPLQWKPSILTTRSPGKSCFLWNVCVSVFECLVASLICLRATEKMKYTGVPWVHAGPLMLCCPFSSVTAKIKAIEAKLKMMAENPDAEYPAAPVYSYFKPPDKKRTTPYSRTAWKSRRWWLWMTALHTWDPLPLYL